jgi:hypothetical protein
MAGPYFGKSVYLLYQRFVLKFQPNFEIYINLQVEMIGKICLNGNDCKF